jgi:hypothetical protein
VQQICEQLGISKPTFYTYFKHRGVKLVTNQRPGKHRPVSSQRQPNPQSSAHPDTCSTSDRSGENASLSIILLSKELP